MKSARPSRSAPCYESGKHYDAALWKQIAELGWAGTAIPEQYGGLGLGYLELCVIAEELGRALAPVPFSSTVYLFAEALLVAGSEEQKQRLLPKVAAGEIIATLARVAKVQAQFCRKTSVPRSRTAN